MNVTPTERAWHSIAIWIAGGCLLTLLLFWLLTGQILVLLIAGLSLTACAFGFLGRRAGQASFVLTIAAVISGQLHWVGGHTICLADPDHPYLWQMQRAASGSTSSSYSDDGETISISFSARSEELIPGARFAEVRVGPDTQIRPLDFRETDAPGYNDTRILLPPPMPDTLEGTILFVPKDAEFRSASHFDRSDSSARFAVADLPVLIQIEDDVFAPLGALTGEISLGSTAQIRPAAFRARNLLMDAAKRQLNTQSSREYFRDKTAPAEAIVDAALRDWALVNPVPLVALNRYAEVHDCRPEVYQELGIGWIFGPGAEWFS